MWVFALERSGSMNRAFGVSAISLVGAAVVGGAAALALFRGAEPAPQEVQIVQLTAPPTVEPTAGPSPTTGPTPAPTTVAPTPTAGPADPRPQSTKDRDAGPGPNAPVTRTPGPGPSSPGSSRG